MNPALCFVISGFTSLGGCGGVFNTCPTFYSGRPCHKLLALGQGQKSGTTSHVNPDEQSCSIVCSGCMLTLFITASVTCNWKYWCLWQLLASHYIPVDLIETTTLLVGRKNNDFRRCQSEAHALTPSVHAAPWSQSQSDVQIENSLKSFDFILLKYHYRLNNRSILHASYLTPGVKITNQHTLERRISAEKS